MAAIQADAAAQYAANERRCATVTAERQALEVEELRRALNMSINAASDLHYEAFDVPAAKAAVVLALTPAPDAQAVTLRISIIKEYELDNYVGTDAM